VPIEQGSPERTVPDCLFCRIVVGEVPATVVVRAAGEVARKEGIDESGYRMVFNTGEHAGRIVFHAHLHVLGGEHLGQFGRPAT
jgi:diadenosine tetraphosphate (Ap4A) HIT family hydrolase